MEKEKIHEYAKKIAKQLPDTYEDYPFGKEHLVYKLRGKIFLFISERNGVKFLTLKSDPEQAKINRAIFDGIKPGYHMNKKHWISLYSESDLHEEIVEYLIKNSYNLVLSTLPKKEKASLNKDKNEY